MQPQAILPRLIKAAESRPGAELPDLPRIEQLIDTQTESDDITKQVQFQWIVKRCPEGRQPEPKELKVLTEEFQTKWKEPAFRRRFLSRQARPDRRKTRAARDDKTLIHY